MEEETRQILGQIKGILSAHHDIGLEPPPVSKEVLYYLEHSRPLISSNQEQNLNSLEALEDFIGQCKRCKLYNGRTHLVFGEGSSTARLVFVGEGPGRDEDLAGRPFVGEAGKLLTRIIENGMRLRRQEVFICNVVKCRPPKNRDPEPDETRACIPFLKHQLRIIGPEVICTLGRVAGRCLLGEGFRISRERGRWHSYMQIPVMPTYHPAYLLRNQSAKRQVWEDIQKVMERLGLEVKRNELV